MRNLKVLLMAVVAIVSVSVQAAEVGKPLKKVEIRDATDAAAGIPDWGNKVLAIFYTDADVADMNDPLADKIKERKPNLDFYRGMGIVNLKDSKAPNFMIRSVVRGKIEKYKSTILTDADQTIPKAWELGDCNNTSVVMVVDKKGVLRKIQRGEIRGKDIDAFVELIEKLIAESATPAAPAADAPAPEGQVAAPAEGAPAAAGTPAPPTPAPAAATPAPAK